MILIGGVGQHWRLGFGGRIHGIVIRALSENNREDDSEDEDDQRDTADDRVLDNFPALHFSAKISLRVVVHH